MPGTLIAILTPLIAAFAIVFITMRLRFFSGDAVPGRYAMLTGGLFVITAAVWQSVKALPDYADWFVITAYPYIDLVQLIAFAIGVCFVLVALAFYHDFWETSREDVAARSARLSILENLSEDALRPYQTIDLLSIALKEILLQFPGTAGTAFLLHRQRRQYVLVEASGLNKQEHALAEYYPVERNIVSQAIELGQPMIGGRFNWRDREGKQVESRFQSTLVLPLTSGMAKLGVIVLLAEEEKLFSRADIRALIPVAGWLAERVHVSRLTRELSSLRTDSETADKEREAFGARLTDAAHALTSSEPVADFCKAVVGLFGAESIHLGGLRNDRLTIHGGSQPLLEMSENFRTALQEAVNRQKPLILNQEAADENGRPFVVSSTLVYPIQKGDHKEALILRKPAPPFVVNDRALARLDQLGALAQVTLLSSATRKLDLTRKLGLARILTLLSQAVPIEDAPVFGRYFLTQLGDVLPPGSSGLALRLDEQGGLSPAGRFGLDDTQLTDLKIEPGESTAGQTMATRRTAFVHGKRAVAEELTGYRAANARALQQFFHTNAYPASIAFCPLTRLQDLAGVVVVFFSDLPPDQRAEYERLLTLASMLYSLRLTVSALQETAEQRPEETSPAIPGEQINQLNNHLSAVVGHAELLTRSDTMPESARRQLAAILGEAEQAARVLKASAHESELPPILTAQPATDRESKRAISQLLDESRISGNVYMAGGRAREIDCRLEALAQADLNQEQLRSLLDAVLNRFAALSDEDEMITLASYRQGDAVFLDVSRHPRNFPPVREVATFGQYRQPDDVLRERPGDVFLTQALDRPYSFAHDRQSDSPTYLSFKFPAAADVDNSHETRPRRPSILAIDDEQVILDLIAAMCQSLEYDVTLCRSGEEGVGMIEEKWFDLVLCDLSMPGMSGLEVARRAARIRPALPVVLVTGWQASLKKDELEAAGVTRVLSKPFRIEQLTDLVEFFVGKTA